MRNRFEQQLNELHMELVIMGALCEDAIGCAAKSLLEQDESLLKKVFVADAQIDQKEREIETLCMKLILQQQPVARDLRTITAALKMISDMERIGDQAGDIAEILGYVWEHDLQSIAHIGDMARATIQMVTDSIDSFVKSDIEMAKSVIAYDDVVDDLFHRVKGELTETICDDPTQAEVCLDVLMIAKYFERIGDHATNIAEWVCYAIDGVRPENEREGGY
ncbi:MAG: phosphate signaling complex protein PhoU [Evtepia sp.]